MSREIEFRGKRKDNGEWIKGYYSRLEDDRYINVHEPYLVDAETNYYENHLVCYGVTPETVGQYINRKDKHGVRIFDGDVLKDDAGRVLEVFYCERHSRWEFKTEAYPIGTPIFDWFDDFAEKRNEFPEIISTIHENPELIK